MEDPAERLARIMELLEHNELVEEEDGTVELVKFGGLITPEEAIKLLNFSEETDE